MLRLNRSRSTAVRSLFKVKVGAALNDVTKKQDVQCWNRVFNVEACL